MNILVINGTEIKGCTHHIKEAFLAPLRPRHSVREFTLPRDMPHFCSGCKNCFFDSEERCPHAEAVMPIWDAMKEADLLVFAYPVYALRATGQLKALLDHLCCHWMVHRPDRVMFHKRAVVLTNSVGAPNGAAQKDVVTSLNWLGVSRVGRLGFGLMEGVIWAQLSPERRAGIERRCRRFAARYLKFGPAGMSLKVRLYFFVSRLMHGALLKKEATLSADNRHWIENGWIKVR